MTLLNVFLTPSYVSLLVLAINYYNWLISKLTILRMVTRNYFIICERRTECDDKGIPKPIDVSYLDGNEVCEIADILVVNH